MNKRIKYHLSSFILALLTCLICVTHAANAQSGTWSVAGTNAPRRDGHSMTKIGDRLYVFGGEYRDTRGDEIDSLTIFDPDTTDWGEVEPETNPPARRDHCAGAIDGKLYIFGGVGSNSQYRSDVWMYDPAFTNWFFQDAQGTKPTARKLSASASFNDKMYIFGGQDTNGYRGDLWEYNPATTNWTLLKAEDPPFNSPPARSGAQAFVHEDKMYIFGGENEYGNPLQDMWKYSPVSGTWMDTSPSGELPKPVKQYASAYTTTGTFWISGGQAEDTSVDPPVYKPTAATWQFVFSSNAWEQLTSAPQAHYGATAAWMTTNATRGTDSTTGDFLLLGGVVDNQTSDQFLRFSIQDTNQPPSSQTISYQYDPAGRLTNVLYESADTSIAYDYDQGGNMLKRTVTGTIAPPSQPTSISARIMDSNTVQITWLASEGALGYEVWRSLDTNAPEQQAVVTNLYYSDAVQALENTYYYWVLAYNDAGTNTLSGTGTKAIARGGALSFLFLLLNE